MAENKKEAPIKKKAPKKEKVGQPLLEALGLLEYPHLTEKSINNIETKNKLLFIVKRNATKKDIKNAVEKAFEVKVKKVNVLTTTKGQKKAIISLSPEFSAADIATKLGMM